MRYRRPFWLPASNYYFLAAAIAIAFFFVIWGILHDGGEETPWIPAGIGASIVLGSAVFLREVILRSARTRFLATQRLLDRNLKSYAAHGGDPRNTNKLTVEKNAAVLKAIKQKSDAAKVLGKLSPGHWEVFELCSEYLSINERELKTVGVGSPRLAALRRGREIAEEFHRYHLLQWAEIEARSLTNEARLREKTSEKVETASRALSVIDTARQYYPDDTNLNESADALKEFIASIKVSGWIERAERAAFKGNLKLAKSLYSDALFYLDREQLQNEASRTAAARIAAEIDRIGQLDDGRSSSEPPVPSRKSKKNKGR